MKFDGLNASLELFKCKMLIYLYQLEVCCYFICIKYVFYLYYIYNKSNLLRRSIYIHLVIDYIVYNINSYLFDKEI